MRKEYCRQRAAITPADYEQCSYLRHDAECGAATALRAFGIESTVEL